MKPKVILPIAVVVIIAVVVGIVVSRKPAKDATTATATTQSTITSPSTSSSSTSDCGLPQKQAFQTLDKQQTDLTNADSPSDYWHLTFTGNNVIIWQQGENLQNGTYTCKGAALTATFGSTTKTGYYNSNSGTLVFDGHNYKIPE